ncbi:unnamed protein product, partial [marine sediment metagenome]
EVNEVKLKNVLHCFELRLATEAEVIEAGIVAGSASPIGITGVKIIANDPTAKAIIENLEIPLEKMKEVAGSVISIKVNGIKPS